MAIVIETCPRCGGVLHDIMLASNPPIPRKECFSCGWSWMGEPEEVIYQPFGGNYVGTENSVLDLNKNYLNMISNKDD